MTLALQVAFSDYSHPPTPDLTLYHRRAWIGNMFGDLKDKDNGFDFERSSFRHSLRLSRLKVEAVAFLFTL